MTDTSATHMPESTGCSPAVQPNSSARNVIGTGWCATVAQLRTGHSPLLAGYLHRIGRRDSATCPHCNAADETAEHLVLRCPAHDQARRDIWLGGVFNTDPRRLWEFLERIGAVTPPPTGNEREGERERERERERVTHSAVPLSIADSVVRRQSTGLIQTLSDRQQIQRAWSDDVQT